MRLLVQHRSLYRYSAPAALGPHTVRLRPATHARAAIESYSLTISPDNKIRWQQDPYGNHVARVTFRSGTRVAALDILVELAVDVRPVNPFDFFLDDRCEKVPFDYPPELVADLSPFLERAPSSPRLDAFLTKLPAAGATVPLVVELNQVVNRHIAYVIREEAGVWTPDETLAAGRGSCRDSALLYMEAVRHLGLAARFVSGYLNSPPSTLNLGATHAWAEVFLPGAGWKGFDPSIGTVVGTDHITVAVARLPQSVPPVAGTFTGDAQSTLDVGVWVTPL